MQGSSSPHAGRHLERTTPLDGRRFRLMYVCTYLGKSTCGRQVGRGAGAHVGTKKKIFSFSSSRFFLWVLVHLYHEPLGHNVHVLITTMVVGSSF